MKHWNVPVMTLSAIKRLVEPFVDSALTIDYKQWFELLSLNKIADNEENRSVLNQVILSLQDTKVDYHIMNLEGLLDTENFGNESLSLQDKMKKVYQEIDFSSYRLQYDQDINKKKNLFLEMVRYVSFMQVEDLIILKYRAEVSFYDLWNEFYMECRGVIIDLSDMTLVASPYRKFFNFNEKPLTSAERISLVMKEAVNVSIKNKEDGSMISVSKHKGNLIVATPGSMESEQSKWAKAFIIKHYPLFVQDMPIDKTFLFEGIYPENRIVIDYKGEEKMVLTNIRNNVDGTYLSESEIYKYSVAYDFEIPEMEHKSLEALLLESKDKVLYPADEKEGWVFTIRTEKETLMFKLKCEDYCEIHQVIKVVNSPKVIFGHIVNDTFDDFISKVPDVVRQTVHDVAQILFEHIQKVKGEVEKYISQIPKDVLFTSEEIIRHDAFKNWLKEVIVPQINDKLARTMKMELKDKLISKAYGKNVHVDKYTESEFQRLWGLIPENLRDQKSIRQKEGKLLGFVYKQIPTDYQSIILDYAKNGKNNYLSLVNIKDIDFSFLKESEDLVEE